MQFKIKTKSLLYIQFKRSAESHRQHRSMYSNRKKSERSEIDNDDNEKQNHVEIKKRAKQHADKALYCRKKSFFFFIIILSSSLRYLK